MTCNHLLGFSRDDEYGEVMFVYGPGPWWKLRPPDKRDTLFKFCPHCGVELEQPKPAPSEDAGQ